MFVIEFIAVVIIISVLSKQSARIGRLEKLLEGKGVALVKTQESSQVFVSPMIASVDPIIAPKASVIEQEVVQTGQVHDETSSGRLLAGLGIGAVFIGVAFFLKYAFDNNWVGPEGRIILGVLTGIVLMSIGQWLRKKYLEYSDFLMGGGLAVLYLSVFSAHFFFQLISPFSAWFFMAMITLVGIVLSIYNATKVLALISIIGGFLTPFMARSGGDDMLALFGYLSILNIGVMTLSFKKEWRELAFTAFLGSSINFFTWYGIYYKPDVLGEVLSFCFASFLIFLSTVVIRSVYQKIKSDEADYFLLLGNALFITSFGYVLLERQHEDLLGLASVFIAVIYLALAFAVNKVNREDITLNLALPGLAVTFFSIAIPMQFDGSWVTVGWYVESLVLYFIASKISNRGFQVMGLTAYILATLSFLQNMQAEMYRSHTYFTPVFNNDFAVLALAVFVAYAIAYMYRLYGSVTVEVQKRGISFFVIVANILTVFAVTTQIIYYFDTIKTVSAQNYSNTLVSIFWAIYAALLTAVGFIKKVGGIRKLGLVLFLITAFKVIIDVWSLGQIYRIVSLIAFGAIALGASFAYAKYKDRLKDVI